MLRITWNKAKSTPDPALPSLGMQGESILTGKITEKMGEGAPSNVDLDVDIE
jgi:hypothetical protein